MSHELLPLQDALACSASAASCTWFAAVLCEEVKLLLLRVQRLSNCCDTHRAVSAGPRRQRGAAGGGRHHQPGARERADQELRAGEGGIDPLVHLLESFDAKVTARALQPCDCAQAAVQALSRRRITQQPLPSADYFKSMGAVKATWMYAIWEPYRSFVHCHHVSDRLCWRRCYV